MTRIGSSLAARMTVPAVVLQAASWFAMLAHGTSWWGGWMNAVDQAAGTVVITGPLLAALVANEYARRRETSLPALAVSGVHPARAWFGPAFRLVGLAWVNLALVVAEAGVLVVTAGVPVFSRPMQVLPLCALVLAAHAMVGMMIGLRVPVRTAGPVAGTVSFALFLLAVAHLAPASFGISAASGDLVGQRYRFSSMVGLGAVALVSLVAVAATTGWSGRWQRAWGWLALVGLAAAMALSGAGLVEVDDRYSVVSVALRCRGTGPAVCVPDEAPRSLQAASTRMHELAAPLGAAGIRLPARWTYYWGQRPPPDGGVLRLPSGGVLGTRVRDADLVASLATPALCPQFFGNPGDEVERALEARTVLEQWLGLRNGLRRTFLDLPRAWFSSPESEEWVRTTYSQLRACDLGSVRLPPR